ncbi:acyltransferase [Enterobacteriaceae bacterium BIT-l23]|uniref:acyltransferase family protein n=1 Tax=Jejubacter sp. L23 TaxID=3092086 RepID=UPI001584533E|nr:acyltransferase [Enterobacteriaceae bacterium BIT-l23]
MKKLDSLQVLRGLAALFVVIFHYHYRLAWLEPDTLGYWHSIFGWSFMGVDIFFVISGFIMVYTTQAYDAGWKSSCKFLLNRATRIIPLYYFFLLVAFFSMGAMSTFHYESKTENLISALTFTVYDANAAPHYIDDSGMYNVRWTLNYELYFYIAFSLCLLLRERMAALISWAACVVFLIPFVFGQAPTLSPSGYDVNHAAFGLMSNPIILDFVIGALSGWLFLVIKKNYNPNWIEKISLLISIILIPTIAYGVFTRHLPILSPKLGGTIGVLILALALSNEIIKKHIPKAFIYLGDISFSLYLSHNTINYIIFKRLGKYAISMPMILLLSIISFLISIAISHITHKLIEVRFTMWIKLKLGRIDNLQKRSEGIAR